MLFQQIPLPTEISVLLANKPARYLNLLRMQVNPNPQLKLPDERRESILVFSLPFFFLPPSRFAIAKNRGLTLKNKDFLY